MTRDDLESVVWQQMAKRHRMLNGGGNGGVSSTAIAVDCAFVAAILEAADAFAATTAATALELNGRTHRPPAVHYLGTGGQPACGYGRGMADPALTSDPGQVTCGACKRTAGHRQALALAVMS